MKIGTITNLGFDNSQKKTKPLFPELAEENFDILCCHNKASNKENILASNSTMANELKMTYAFTIANYKKSKKNQDKLTGLTILAGQSTWMLSSGSFPLTINGKSKQSAQFAIVRKNGNTVLVLNIFFDKANNSIKINQLKQLLSHPVLNKPYSAVLLCGNFNIKKDGSAKTDLPYTIKNSLLESGVKRNSLKKNCGANMFVLEPQSDLLNDYSYNNGQIVTDFYDSEKSSPEAISFELKISRKEQHSEQQIYRYVSCTNSWRKTPKFSLGVCE